MKYNHLSQNERYQIFALMKAGLNQTQVALTLGRSKSTISREIERNSGLKGYRPKQATLKSEVRALGSRNAKKVSVDTLKSAFDLVRQEWSPEQIAGTMNISHETVYRHVYADKDCGGKLFMHLRSQKKRRKRYASGRQRRGQIPNRRSIHERPAVVDLRLEVGHWEGDTVIGARHKQAIVTLVERKSGYAKLFKVSNKTAELVSAAMIESLKPFDGLVDTITLDNGKEFTDHQKVDLELGSTIYFADPFASWQRGTNENFNGLLRQYIPKDRPLSTVTQEELKMIENKLNHRPRKRLGFKTPHEVFHESLNRVALRV
jgi:transposase, IS30 family